MLELIVFRILNEGSGGLIYKTSNFYLILIFY